MFLSDSGRENNYLPLANLLATVIVVIYQRIIAVKAKRAAAKNESKVAEIHTLVNSEAAAQRTKIFQLEKQISDLKNIIGQK